MKQDTSTPSFLSLRGTEGQSLGPVEWLPHCNFKQSQNFSPSSVSLSSSSSIGTRTSDESIESGSITDEDDPIISLQALSLDTPKISFGDEGKEKTSGKTLFKSKGMDTKPEKKEDRPSSSFQCKDEISTRRRRPNSHFFQFNTSEFNSRRVQQNNCAPFAQLSGDSPTLPVTQTQQQRPNFKKYTIRKSSATKPSTFVSEDVSPKVSRTKRERGGSDFTMASASDNKTTSPRKRRRVNRNQAMGAQDFDSILAQINTTGSL